MYVDTDQPPRLTRRYDQHTKKIKSKNTTYMYLGILQMMSTLPKVHTLCTYVHTIDQVGQVGRYTYTYVGTGR